MSWWGWGEDAGAITLPDAAASMLRAELGLDGSESGERVELEEVRLRRPALGDAARRRLERGRGRGGTCATTT